MKHSEINNAGLAIKRLHTIYKHYKMKDSDKTFVEHMFTVINNYAEIINREQGICTGCYNPLGKKNGYGWYEQTRYSREEKLFIFLIKLKEDEHYKINILECNSCLSKTNVELLASLPNTFILRSMIDKNVDQEIKSRLGAEQLRRKKKARR